MIDRRVFLATGAGALLLPGARAAEPAASAALAASAPLAALRRGGAVLLMRHAQTDPGVGDPPGFRLDQCATQRNLSDAGRAQARAAGAWLAQQGLRPHAVRSSAWCRCIDTATLAFGRAEAWEALNSFFGDRSGEPGQSRRMLDALAQVRAGRFEAWVTHQVNISAFAGDFVGMGEAIVVRAAGGRVENVGRLQLPA
jgi:phosphohistidine phosphatase SixA